jgi:hypothetical protein
MLSRLTKLHIHIIGAFVSIIVAVLLFFILIRPQQDTLKKTQAETDNLLTTEHGNEDVAHAKDLENKQAEQAQIVADWKTESGYYMPLLPFGQDPLATYPLIGALPEQFSMYVQKWYNVQRPLGITATDASFTIPDFPADPNFASTLQNLTFPEQGRPWSVTVKCASFDALMAHLKRFNTQFREHGMPVINNVSLSGQSSEDRPDSQDLYASYDLSLYLILSQKPPAADPRIGPTGGGGGGGLGGLLGGGKAGGAGAGGRKGGFSMGGPGARGGARMGRPGPGG